MKNELCFKTFLAKDIGTNYYFKINYINVIKGKNGNFYEIFVNNLNEIKENKENIIIERYLNYLEENSIDYNLEEEFYNIAEYISVYDSKECLE